MSHNFWGSTECKWTLGLQLHYKLLLILPCCYELYLHYGIHRTGFLAKATVYALGHVNVIAYGSPAAVSPGFCFYSDGLKEREREKRNGEREREKCMKVCEIERGRERGAWREVHESVWNGERERERCMKVCEMERGRERERCMKWREEEREVA